MFGLALWLADGETFNSLFAAPKYLVRPWQAEDGLPDNKVAAVLQTRDGYIWVGTFSGLARFDGVRFVSFNDSNTPEMHDSSVTSLYEAADGTLWIGHGDGELTRHKNGRFEAVEIHANWGQDKIAGIGADESGDIWILNTRGDMARLKDGVVVTAKSGPANGLLEMTRSKSGTIWVARGGRLSQLEGEKLTVINMPGGLTNRFIHGICASHDGGLWLAIDGDLRELKDDKWVKDLGPAPWGLAPIHTFIETRTGLLAAGTAEYGFSLVNPGETGQNLHFSRTNGFVSDWVLSLCEDHEGGIWVGTGGAGLCLLRARNVDTIAPPDQWENRAVLSVTAVRDGSLWVGTDGAGLYHFNEGNWDKFSRDAGIRNPYIWSILEDAQGDLWAGSWSGGLYLRQGDHFDHAPAPGLSNVTIPMPAMVEARQGGMWIGTGTGLLRYKAGQTEWFGQDGNGPSRDVRAVLEDDEGAVWFGTYGGGLGRLKDGRIQQFRKADGLASDFINCLHRDRDGALWIGTFGGGLNRYKQGHFTAINEKQGLPNGVICDIEDDGQGFFWMSSYSGLIRVSQSELDSCADGQIKEIHCLSYGVNDGLPTSKCSGGLQPAGCRTADGRLWFSTSKGLAVVDPRKMETNLLAPPVVIENFLVDDQLVTEGAVPGAQLRIPPGRHRFEFEYTGLSFVAPEKVQFKHRLDGWEKEWIAAGTKRSVNYNYIPPGDYSFHVTACNNDGIWNETGAEIAFTVLPYFWQTVWFRIFGGVMTLIAGGSIVWVDTRRRMRRKLDRIERQRALELERTRIARDIHDDLGASLTRIAMLSDPGRSALDGPEQATANLKRIYRTTREVTRSMEEVVWAVDPRHDTFDSLVIYLQKYAQDFLESAGIRCRLDLPSQFPFSPLTAEVRHNLFLAFKEATNNIVKHASASEVRISLTLEPMTFAVTIEDNGRGFAVRAAADEVMPDPAHPIPGNGTKNMRSRLAEIGGACEIRSDPTLGTTVKFVLPIKAPSA